MRSRRWDFLCVRLYPRITRITRIEGEVAVDFLRVRFYPRITRIEGVVAVDFLCVRFYPRITLIARIQDEVAGGLFAC